MSGLSKALARALLASATMMTPVATLGQEVAGPSEAAAETPGGTVIVVTARKREERLQDVPISIRAFSQEEIDRLGLTDAESLSRLSPSVIFDRSANPEASSIAIRGLSPTRGRANAAILVDGIDVTSEAVGSSGGGFLLSTRLLDLERIEIVRGPQSVQYGRSAFAGGIQYVTRDPAPSFEGTAIVEAGTRAHYSSRLSASGPVVDGVFGVRIGANLWGDGGFYRDEATLSRLGGGEGYGLSATGLLTPAPNLRLRGRVEYFDDSHRPAAQFLLRSNSGLINAANNPAIAAAVAAGVTSNTSFAVYRGIVPDADELGRPLHSPDPLTGRRFRGSDREVFRASLVGTYDAGFGTITSWTGFTDGQYRNRQDFDQDAILAGTPGNMIDTANRTSIQDSDTGVEQFSQELRFASSWAGPVRLMVGGLYWTEDALRNSRTVTVACAATIPECAQGAAGRVPFVNLVNDPTSRSIRHWSLYGGVEWSFVPALKLTVEARSAWEEETVIGSNCGLPVNRFGISCGDPFAASQFTPPVFGPSSLLSDGRTMAAAFAVPHTVTTNQHFITPRFTLEWNPSRDLLLYASASKGVKPGGTSTLAAGAWLDSDLDGDTDELAYESEILWAYEVGNKSTWFGGLLQTNIAAFYLSYSDKQVVSTQSTPSGFPIAVIRNAGAARVWGLELEARWAVTPRIGLGLGYTFLDTRYTDFLLFTDTKSGIIDAGHCVPIMLDKPVCQVDLTGNRLEKAPRHALIASLSYSAPVRLGGTPGTRFFVESDTTYQSRRFVDQSNNRILQGYSVTDVRLGLRNANWEIMGFVQNLFDDDTVRSADTKTGDVDRIGLGLSTSTQAVIATLPERRRFGVRGILRF